MTSSAHGGADRGATLRLAKTLRARSDLLLFVFFLFTILPPSDTLAASYHIGTRGSISGTGSLSNPWDLQTALNHPSVLLPGDTLWVHGGVYTGAFSCFLHGTSAKPIVVRNYRQEQAVIQSSPSNDASILWIRDACCYTWFWGLHFEGSQTVDRLSSTPTPDGSVTQGDGLFTQQSGAYYGVKVINCVIHDLINGCLVWKECQDAEVYGNIIYNNGYEGPAGDRGHGHGIYTMNRTGRKLIADNILFNGYGNGIQAYGAASQYADNLTIAGNVLINAGSNSALGGGWNMIVGTAGTRPAVGDTIRENWTYRQPGAGNYGGVDIGWDAGQEGVAVLNNYFVAGAAGEVALRLTRLTNATVRGNTIMGRLANFTPGQYPNNLYRTAPPGAGDTSFVRVNKYEPTRATVVVYNWSGRDSVSVDLHGFAPPGSLCTLVNAQNPLGDAPYRGTVDRRGRLAVPLLAARWTVAAPIGGRSPASTFPFFGAFIVNIAYGPPIAALHVPRLLGPPRGVTAGNAPATTDADPQPPQHTRDARSEFRLGQSYPGPLNPLTSIDFYLPERAPVSLMVFDKHGTEIASLALGVLEAGAYHCPWDASGLASGIYYCRLAAGSYTAVRKIVLVKWP